MKILAIYKYYWPDTTPYARLLKGILETWVTDGHEAVVYTAQPGYNDIVHEPQPGRESLGGVDIHRLPTLRERKSNPLVRLVSFLGFLAGALGKAVRNGDFDFVIVNPHPPILMGITVRLLKALRGIPYVYHCEDIHPESARLAGTLGSGFLYRLLRRIDTWNCRGAGLIVTLSEDMVETLVERGVERERILVINNFVLGEEVAESGRPEVLREAIGEEGKNFVLLFAGNLGLYQGLETVLRVADLMRDEPEVKFVFMGEGAAKAGLVRDAGDLVGRTVFFLPYQPLEIAKQAMGSADLSLIPLAKGIHRVAYPSKTMNCLAMGCPLLAIVEDESQLAQEIRDHRLGHACPQGDPPRVVAAIREARKAQGSWRADRARIAAWADETFGRKAILARWTSVPLRVRGRRSRP